MGRSPWLTGLSGGKGKKQGTINLKERIGNSETKTIQGIGEYREEQGRQVLYKSSIEELEPVTCADRIRPAYSGMPWPTEEAEMDAIEAEAKEPGNLYEMIDAAEEAGRLLREKENAAVIRVRDKVKQKFHTRILNERDSAEFRKELYDFIEDALKDEGRSITSDRRADVAVRITNLIVGLGPLETLIDKGYTEIMVSRFDKIYVEENGGMVKVDAQFGSEEELETMIYQLASSIGRTINKSEPMCDGYLKDGSRFNAVLPPIAADGATLTIRRFSDKKLTGEDYLKFGSLNEDILKFFEYAVRARFNIICSGGTGSGKTSLLNLMSNYLSYDPGLSVVTIEDSLELRINHPNVRREETRKSTSKDGSGEVTARMLVKNALRQRPDRILIGEIRDGTMADFLRAAGSGHDGCMTTIHANSPKEVESQVVVLFMMADDYNLDPDTIKMMYAQAVDIVIQIKRYSDHKRRISHISHIVGYGLQACEELGIMPSDPEYSDRRVYVRDIFRYEKTGQNEDGSFIGDFVPTGYIPKSLIEKAETNGAKIDMSIFVPKKNVQSGT